MLSHTFENFTLDQTWSYDYFQHICKYRQVSESPANHTISLHYMSDSCIQYYLCYPFLCGVGIIMPVFKN